MVGCHSDGRLEVLEGEEMVGPLHGVRVVEMAGIGPGPFAGMMLADMGAEVLRIDRPDDVELGASSTAPVDVVGRGRRSVAVDLKHRRGAEVVLHLVELADVLIEGFRPGVMERLGLGPDACMARNPALVYGRMTGWGQEGPYAQTPGHDVNYLALAGVLDAIGRAGDAPVPPLNLVGDFGGGAMYLVFGIACALFERATTGLGQIVDAAMVDGAASLMAQFHGMVARGEWSLAKGTNALDTGSHFYEVYETADGRFVSIGAIEPKFYGQLIDRLGLGSDPALPDQLDSASWPGMKERLRAIIRGKSQAEWMAVLEGTDVCFAPVLSLLEAPEHPHNLARGTFVEVNGLRQPAPAPRFSRSVCRVTGPPAYAGEHTAAALSDWGFEPEHIADLLDGNVVVECQ